MFHNCNSEEITTGAIVNIRLVNETKPDTGKPGGSKELLIIN